MEVKSVATDISIVNYGGWCRWVYSPLSLSSYYVITYLMATVFEGKVRRLGNSMAVIIPKEVLEETGAREGDVVKLSVPIPRQRRVEAFRKMAGIDSGNGKFARERGDRV
jgi:antitoxin component of MazEF toxin-antitoxin module